MAKSKKADEPEKTEFGAATDLFHEFSEEFTYSKHQKSYNLALLYLEGHIFKRMQTEKWPLGDLPFLRVREIIDTLVTSAGEWGSSMYGSQVREPGVPVDADTQMPFEVVWKELGLLENDEFSLSRRTFDAVFAGHPMLPALLDYCVDYLNEILSEQFPEFMEYPDLFRELLDVHVWTCARLEFLYSTYVPVLSGRADAIMKAFEFGEPPGDAPMGFEDSFSVGLESEVAPDEAEEPPAKKAAPRKPARKAKKKRK